MRSNCSKHQQKSISRIAKKNWTNVTFKTLCVRPNAQHRHDFELFFFYVEIQKYLVFIFFFFLLMMLYTCICILHLALQATYTYTFNTHPFILRSLGRRPLREYFYRHKSTLIIATLKNYVQNIHADVLSSRSLAHDLIYPVVAVPFISKHWNFSVCA